MSDYHSVNVVAVAVGDIPMDSARTYLALFATSDVTVTIYAGGTAGQPFTIAAGSQWGPHPAPMNEIRMTGTGTLVMG